MGIGEFKVQFLYPWLPLKFLLIKNITLLLWMVGWMDGWTNGGWIEGRKGLDDTQHFMWTPYS